MELKPTEPPGHAKRKLRGLVGEIARLRAEGYTIRAIHEALTAAGIGVGWATVQREVARLARVSPAMTATRPASVQRTTPSETEMPTPAETLPRPAADVDRYFDQQSTNPLFKKKGNKG